MVSAVTVVASVCLLPIAESFFALQCFRSVYLQPTRMVRETVFASETEEKLSDVDTRVLQSMLSDSKLDLKTEEDLRKLLERGMKKTVVKQPEVRSPLPQKPSPYSSTPFKTMTDSSLWKKFSLKASDFLESIGIWVSNKVEQDIKVLAALGLFAWDRAVRDVSRALPEVSSHARKASRNIFLLTNNSSFEEESSIDEPHISSIAEEMRRPIDELKTVVREAWGILSGRQRSTSGRSLRSAAPAGFTNSVERQRRAYEQQVKVSRQEKDVTRIAGNVVDTAWELRRELSAEVNQPGYKTEPIRNAIAAGVSGTGNILKAAAVGLSLPAGRPTQQNKQEQISSTEQISEHSASAPYSAKGKIVAPSLSIDVDYFEDIPVSPQNSKHEKDLRLQSSHIDAETDEYALSSGIDHFADTLASVSIADDSTTANVAPMSLDELAVTLAAERIRVSENLRKCIEEPDCSWLKRQCKDISDESLTEIVTMMVLLRNDIIEQELMDNFESADVLFNCLRDIRFQFFDIVKKGQDCLSAEAVEGLRDELFGVMDSNGNLPLILSLEQVDDLSQLATKASQTLSELGLQHEDNLLIEHDDLEHESRHFFAREVEETQPRVSFEIVDVIGDSFTQRSDSHFSDISGDTRRVVAEVVSDIDFDKATDGMKVAKVLSEESVGGEHESDNVALQTALRSMDIMFFVLEKFVVFGIPYALLISMTVMQRLEGINLSGKGRSGWRRFQKLAEPKGRY